MNYEEWKQRLTSGPFAGYRKHEGPGDAVFEKWSPEKTPGQVAHETFHETLEAIGGFGPSHGGWGPLKDGRKNAWEAAATAACVAMGGVKPDATFVDEVDKAFRAFRTPIERWASTLDEPPRRPSHFVGVDPGSKDPGVFFVHGDVMHGAITASQRALAADTYYSPTERAVVPLVWLSARTSYSNFVSQKIYEAVFGKKEQGPTMQETNDDKLKASTFELEELRTEVSNLNDELSEVRVERETLRATLERADRDHNELRGRLAGVQGERDAARAGHNARAALDYERERDAARMKLTTVEQANVDLLAMVDSLLAEREGCRPVFDFQRRAVNWGKIEIQAKRRTIGHGQTITLNVDNRMPREPVSSFLGGPFRAYNPWGF